MILLVCVLLAFQSAQGPTTHYAMKDLEFDYPASLAVSPLSGDTLAFIGNYSSEDGKNLGTPDIPPGRFMISLHTNDQAPDNLSGCPSSPVKIGTASVQLFACQDSRRRVMVASLPNKQQFSYFFLHMNANETRQEEFDRIFKAILASVKLGS